MNRNQLHILFLPKWYPNKLDPYDGNFIENYAQAIKNHCEITVLFVHSNSKQDSTYESFEETKNGIREIRIFFKKPQFSISILNKIFSAIRYRKAQLIGYNSIDSKKIDLVHIHVLTRSSWLALHLKKRFNIPFVISEHWSGFQKKVGGYKGFLKKWYTEKVVREAEIVHTVSTPLKEAMESHGLQNEYEVIPNVVDTHLFKPKEKTNHVTEIIYVGNLLQQPKRILDIIEQIGLIAKEQNQIRLSIYGEGQDESACRELIQKLNLQDIVKLMGVRDRNGIAEAIRNADFLLLFSSYENQPCVINEALACGIPVVVPAIPGISELMQKELGITFPTDDRELFKAAVTEMIKSHQNYNSETIRNFALKRFSEEEIAKNFLFFYHKALKIEAQ